MMSKFIYPTSWAFRRYRGNNFSHCINALCPLYGIARDDPRHPQYGIKPLLSGYLHQAVKCPKCLDNHFILANRGVVAEIVRLKRAERPRSPSCPNDDCRNHNKPIARFPKGYAEYGSRKSGPQRFLCRETLTLVDEDHGVSLEDPCKSTLSAKSHPEVRQKDFHLNDLIFRCLVNKTPLRGIARIFDISPGMVLDRIDFFHRQVQLWNAFNEKKLIGNIRKNVMNISVDAQEFIVNSSRASLTEPVYFRAYSACCSQTGYVFRSDVNYDPRPSVLKAEARYRAQSLRNKLANRRETLHSRRPAHICINPAQLEDLKAVKNKLAQTKNRIERNELKRSIKRLKTGGTLSRAFGLQVHQSYTAHAHFYLLDEMLFSIPIINYICDGDPDILSAGPCVAHKRIKEKRGEVFWYRFDTNKNDIEAFNTALQKFYDEKLKTGLSDIDAANRSIEMQVDKLVEVAKRTRRSAELIPRQRRKDRRRKSLYPPQLLADEIAWIKNPFPLPTQINREARCLTNLGDENVENLIWAIQHASSTHLDAYFSSARRRISMLERSLATTARDILYTGYAPHDPGRLVKLLEIWRTYYNLCERRGDDDMTPAMRLQMIDRPVTIEEILTFEPWDAVMTEAVKTGVPHRW